MKLRRFIFTYKLSGQNSHRMNQGDMRIQGLATTRKMHPKV